MNKTIKIYCEGTKGSHDFDILEKIIKGYPIKIEPIGSKKGAGSAIQVFEKLTDPSDYYFLFRDRDFDKDLRELKKEGLFKDDKKDNNGKIVGQWCFSYRTTIENYLFDAQIFYEYLEANKLLDKYKIMSVNDVKSKFILAAKKTRYYQAVRHTLGEMRKMVNFGTSWEESGTLPKDLDEKFCHEKALDYIKQLKEMTYEWTEQSFKTKIASFLKIFDENFFEEMLFLVWFQGKDFATSLSQEFSGLSLKAYYKFSKQNFNYEKFADLVEFRNLITSKL